MTKLPAKRLLASLLLTIMFISNASLAFNFQDVPAYTLRYKVIYKNTPAGELEIDIEKNKDRVIVRGETFPNALANLLGDGKIIETIEYMPVGDSLRLTRLTEKKGRDSTDTKRLMVDHQKNIITTHQDQFLISKHDQIDAYTFPLLSILGLNDTQNSREETLVSADKVRRYLIHPPKDINLTTQAGEFKTVMQAKTRQDKHKTITTWLTKTAPIMPVKIQIDRDGKLEATVVLIKQQLKP